LIYFCFAMQIGKINLYAFHQREVKFKKQQKFKAMKKLVLFILAYAIVVSLKVPVVSQAQSVLLYQNSFETPLVQPAPNCGADLDASFVNTLWEGLVPARGRRNIRTDKHRRDYPDQRA